MKYKEEEVPQYVKHPWEFSFLREKLVETQKIEVQQQAWTSTTIKKMKYFIYFLIIFKHWDSTILDNIYQDQKRSNLWNKSHKYYEYLASDNIYWFFKKDECILHMNKGKGKTIQI